MCVLCATEITQLHIAQLNLSVRVSKPGHTHQVGMCAPMRFDLVVFCSPEWFFIVFT